MIMISLYIHYLTLSWLVVWNIFFYNIWDVILPIDELIFFRWVGQPPTRYIIPFGYLT